MRRLRRTLKTNPAGDFGRVVVVLCDVSHSGNIGAAARAIKTMGFSRLALAAPKAKIDAQARARAAGALDILDDCAVFADVDAALADAAHTIAYTARRRELAAPLLSANAAAEYAAKRIRAGGEVALLFGGEKAGLDNKAVARASRVAEIPANPDYSSLNLAAAVQIAAYETRRALAADMPPPLERKMPTENDKRLLIRHCLRVIKTSGFVRPDDKRPLERRLRRLLARAEPDAAELKLLRGLLAAIEKNLS
jgi:TrmH family RNA methyltransferase